MIRPCSFAFALVALGIAFAPRLAHADSPPPNIAGCSGKKAGDGCKTDVGAPGKCAEQTCSRIDYSKRPPGSATYPCILCVESKGSSSGSTSSGSTSSGTLAPVTSGTSGTSGGSSATGGPGAGKSGCATAPARSSDRDALPLGIGLALAGLALVRRRG